MEEDMVEDNVSEEVEYTFTAYEIDLDYEFDAARFFDFSLAESPLEELQAEVWFDSAGSYPPSPFALKFSPREGIMLENVNISPKSKGVDDINLLEGDSNIEVDQEISAVDMNYRDDVRDKGTSTTQQINSMQKFQNPSKKLPSGLTFYNHMMNNINSKTQTKLSKPSFPRASTLMKPTASQLAKQNHPLQGGYPRSNMSFLDKTSSTSTCGIENQAAKRQKLEGGLLRKVEGAVLLQQTNFVHKMPKRDGVLGYTTHTKPRITIPREPDLETAYRAQKTRSKSTKETANVASAVRKFKALPLNRKILEAPSMIPKRSTPRLPEFQEFHLKTMERAMQHSSAVSKFTVPCNNSDKALNKYATNLAADCQDREPSSSVVVLPSLINVSRPDGCESSHSFKALALNRKILTSKGDLGVFRNSKKETTVPMEFNFQMEKRSHHHPPIELFNKLSLASEATQTPIVNSQWKLPQSISISMKGSKENRWGCFQQGNEIKQPTKSKPLLLREKQQFSADEVQRCFWH